MRSLPGDSTMSLFALAALIVGSTFLSSCTVLGDCGRERQFCIGVDCECGKQCNGDEDCEDGEDDTCAFYERTPAHGVCVSPEFARKHGVGNPANNDSTNNATTNNGTNNTNGDTNNDETPCQIGANCTSGLCCMDGNVCVSVPSQCEGALACARADDIDDRNRCVGACEDSRNCAPGWYCDSVRDECVEKCDSNMDCLVGMTCDLQSGRCKPSAGDMGPADMGPADTGPADMGPVDVGMTEMGTTDVMASDLGGG